MTDKSGLSWTAYVGVCLVLLVVALALAAALYSVHLEKLEWEALPSEQKCYHSCIKQFSFIELSCDHVVPCGRFCFEEGGLSNG